MVQFNNRNLVINLIVFFRIAFILFMTAQVIVFELFVSKKRWAIQV